MNLVNQQLLPKKLIIPGILKEKISIFSNTNITKEELLLFEKALSAVGNHLQIDSVNLNDFYKLNIFFTYDGSISLIERDESNNGSQFSFAVYRMKKLRSFNNDIITLFVYIEELTHYFWRIYDETLVKYKIVEIIKDIVPNFTIDIAKGWGLNGL